jgi:flagellar biosynthesis protein FlhB
LADSKTERATPKRLEKARQDGDSGASSYAAQAVAFLVAIALVPSATVVAASRCSAWLEAVLVRVSLRPALVAFDPSAIATTIVGIVAPVLLATGLTAAAVSVVQTGGAVSAKKLAPDLSRLDPIAGLRKLFSSDRLVAVLRSLLASSVVAYVGYRQLRLHAPELSRVTGRLGLVGGVATALAQTVARDAALVGLAVALVDVAIVRQSWMKRLMMSPDEVKREHRESEGDPQMKAARERGRREILASASLASIKNASVVVVNPTHLACALKYKEDEDGAPVVLASGEGDLAERIVRAAHDYGIPIVRDVPLAHALRELEIGDTIPEALYEAVAEILRAAWEEDRKGGHPEDGEAGR